MRALGGYDPGPVTEDYELWLRMFEAGKVFGTIPQALVVWRDRADRLTRVDPRCAEPALRRLKHKHLLSGPLKEISSCRIWGAGARGLAHARELLALGARVDDIIGTVSPEMSASERSEATVTDPGEVGAPDGRMILLTLPSGNERRRVERRLHRLGYQRERDYLTLH